MHRTDGLLIVTRYTRQLRNEKRHGGGHSYTTLGNQRHSRAESRRNLMLSDDSDMQNSHYKSKSMSPMRTPGSAGSTGTYDTPQGATFFPLTPRLPAGFKSEEETKHGKEETADSVELSVPKETV